jgi:hypothetical protein
MRKLEAPTKREFTTRLIVLMGEKFRDEERLRHKLGRLTRKLNLKELMLMILTGKNGGSLQWAFDHMVSCKVFGRDEYDDMVAEADAMVYFAGGISKERRRLFKKARKARIKIITVEEE